MLVVPVLFVVIAAAGIAFALAARARRNGALALLASELSDGRVDPNGSGVTGTARGVLVTYRFITKGSGSSAESWTEVVARGPRAELDLELRPSSMREERAVARGDAVDIVVGDPPFDAAFIVEGAPASAVKKLLDAPLRKDLLSFPPVFAKTTDEGAKVEKRGWIEDVPRALVLIDIAASLAARAPAAVAEMVAESAVDQSSAYRGAISSDGGRAALDAARDEIQQLRGMRTAREERRVRAMLAVFAIAVVAWLVIVIASRK